MWFMCDLMNLISVIMSNGLLTQLLVGIVWFGMTTIMTVQLIYYNLIKKKRLMRLDANISFSATEIV